MPSSTLGRSRVSALNVGRSSVSAHPSISIKSCSDRSPTSVAEKGRPFTATQISVILGELLLRKDFLSGTSEGNLLSQDRSSSGSTPKGSCTSVLTIKQTNKQTPSYYRTPCHLKSNSSSRPSLISPLKIHPGRTPWFGVGCGRGGILF